MAAEYRFLTTWLLEAERERVWAQIYDSDSWPQWWRGVRVAETLVRGDERGLGQVGRYVWRGAIPYPVSFDIRTTRAEHPYLLEGEATGGLEGTGRWRLFEDTGVTAVLYEWNVRTNKRWMNLIAPVAKPVFEWNHDWVMRNGGRGLAARLGCRLLAAG
jgi:uncharacterized protein YndB with AHSA1/START domain